MRILVCGGREFGLTKEQHRFVFDTLYQVCNEFNLWSTPDSYGNKLPTCHIIHGAAKGADSCAWDFAANNRCECTVFRADWDSHGKSAGYIRNKRMLDEGKPDLVVAFPGGRGTANMVELSKKAGVPVREIKYVSSI